MNAPEECCGFGGGFAVKMEPLAVSMAMQKIEDASSTGADFLISTDSSCLMHLESIIRKNPKGIKVMHLADVLASGWE
jgi:L-lactate dehydrogenase complex protein LldE